MTCLDDFCTGQAYAVSREDNLFTPQFIYTCPPRVPETQINLPRVPTYTYIEGGDSLATAEIRSRRILLISPTLFIVRKHNYRHFNTT